MSFLQCSLSAVEKSRLKDYLLLERPTGYLQTVFGKLATETTQGSVLGSIILFVCLSLLIQHFPLSIQETDVLNCQQITWKLPAHAPISHSHVYLHGGSKSPPLESIPEVRSTKHAVKYSCDGIYYMDHFDWFDYLLYTLVHSLCWVYILPVNDVYKVLIWLTSRK